MSHYIIYPILILLIAAIAGCKPVTERLITSQKRPTITIWVHGTKLMPKPFFKNFFYVRPGMHTANSYDEKYHIRTIAQTLHTADPISIDFKSFYIFGWSGKLSFEARKDAAADLYAEMDSLVRSYSQRYKIRPFIRIITHSHGGNVALNLIHYAQPTPAWHVDELVLLACPVQDCTMGHAENPLFKRVRSLYSDTDLIQIIDPQGLYMHHKKESTPLLSQRCFGDLKTVTNIKVKFARRGLLHIDFLQTSFLHYLPLILKKLFQQNQDSCRGLTATLLTDEHNNRYISWDPEN